MKKNKLLSILALCLISWHLTGQISGTIFRDFNGNGTKEANEPLVSGVAVKAFDAAGGQCANTVSAGTSTPNYTLPTGCAGQVRVEFQIPSAGNCVNSGIDFSSTSASTYGSSVQFVTASATNVNFAIHNPSDYNVGTTNVSAYVPIYISGDPLPSGSEAGSKNWFVGYPYGNSGSPVTTPPAQTLNGSIIGSTWGVAYSKQANKIFTSAFLKRHVGLGVMGSGGIYMLEPTATSFNVTQFYNMDTNGHRTRADGTAPAYGSGTSYTIAADNATITYEGAPDPLTGKPVGLGVIGTNAQRNLNVDPLIPTYDPAAFDQVGKVGLGDIDLSDDGKYLFVMNLYSRKVFRLELNSADNPTSVVGVTSYNVPATSCNAGEYRPFGLKFYRNKLYVGVVCSGENSGAEADLHAFVYELNNPTAAAAFNTTALIDVALDFNRSNKWAPWTNDSDNPDPAPVLSDIEFTDNGDMALVFMDRSGHQWGENNRRFLKTSNTSFSYSSSGDILVAGLNCSTGAYTLENNGIVSSANGLVLTGSNNNNQGPGGKEFFNDDAPAGDPHDDVLTGSAALLKGQGEIFLTAYALSSLSGDGGTFRLSTTNGAYVPSSVYNLYYRSNLFPGILAKANGLGDIELTSIESPMEIGNRVWMDTDSDGVQDADEMGLDGIPVKLYSGATLVATKTTANGGQYYFSTADGVLPNTAYTLRIEAAGFPSGKFVTLKDQATGGIQDMGDNDASLVGANADISYTTGNIGENNHTLDFGFSATPTVSCQPDSIKICAGQTAELVGLDGLTNYRWYIINAPGDTVQVGTGQTFTTTVPGNYIYKANDNSGCPAALCCPVTVADSSCCVINNINLVIGTCDNKGTLSNANDDEYTFTLNPTGSGIGTSYTVNGLPNSPQTGTYGSPTTFGPYLISAGLVTISVVDNVSSNCSKTGNVSPPPPCSSCSAAPPVLSVTDNICPSRTGSINVVQGCGAGSFIEYSTNNGVTWSTTKPLYSTIAKTILARCVNIADNNCKSTNASVTTDPKKCTGGGSDCELIATATVDPCQDNGTGDVATDDYFTIQVNASASNGGSSQRFEVVIGASLPTGIGGNVLNSGGTPYGSPVTVGQNKQFKADGSTSYSLIVRDIDNKSCFQQVNITPVAPCSSLPPKSPCYPVPCVPIGLQKN